MTSEIIGFFCPYCGSRNTEVDTEVEHGEIYVCQECNEGNGFEPHEAEPYYEDEL
jgi:predicted RNA-binding Zn-ribbon protein involved in translation (DUF1610 family)